MIILLRSIHSYSTTDFNHQYLKSLLKHIHEVHPNVVSICRILKPAAERLIKTHRLSRDDKWDTVSEELENYVRRST